MGLTESSKVEFIFATIWTGYKLQTEKGGLANIWDGSLIFQLMKRGGHLSISPVYGVDQVEIENSCKTFVDPRD